MEEHEFPADLLLEQALKMRAELVGGLMNGKARWLVTSQQASFAKQNF